jgi:hypothetical protein
VRAFALPGIEFQHHPFPHPPNSRYPSTHDAAAKVIQPRRDQNGAQRRFRALDVANAASHGIGYPPAHGFDFRQFGHGRATTG